MIDVNKEFFFPISMSCFSIFSIQLSISYMGCYMEENCTLRKQLLNSLSLLSLSFLIPKDSVLFSRSEGVAEIHCGCRSIHLSQYVVNSFTLNCI